LARVPEAELERIKAGVSLERLAEAKGVELKRHGADLLGLCPFHDDREPSLVISPGKNLWHCLGACQAGGSVIDWVMRTEGVSFRHAVELLRTDPLLAASSAGVVRQSTVPKLPSPVAVDADDAEALRQVTDYYHSTLLAAPEASMTANSSTRSRSVSRTAPWACASRARIARPVRRCESRCSAWGFSATPVTSISTVRSLCPSSRAEW
jgi:DNA primase